MFVSIGVNRMFLSATGSSKTLANLGEDGMVQFSASRSRWFRTDADEREAELVVRSVEMA